MPSSGLHTKKSEDTSWGSTAMLALATCLSAFSFTGCTNSRKIDTLDNVNSVTAQQDRFTLGTDLTLTSGDSFIGTIKQYKVSFREGYVLYDGEGKKTASAIKHALSFGVEIDIYNEKGEKLGMISEKVLETKLALISTYYEITNSEGEVIADSKKTDLAGTEITITSPSGEHLATLSRSFFDMGKDTWEITISEDIDPRLIVFIPGFKTHSDDAKSKKSSKKKSSK